MTPERRRGIRRRAVIAAAGLVLLLAAAVVAGWLFLRASLPATDGEIAAAGLRGPVTVTRDAAGMATITGSERGDVAFATGFVHAQERFFQMDLLRRAGAGELAALLGPRLVAVDRERRLHRFRHRAATALATLPPSDRLLLERYAAGVNAGLGALGARPFEYALLGTRPEPWRVEDSLLVVDAMYFELQEDQLARLFSRGFVRDRGTSAEQLVVLLPESSVYDAPLDAASIVAVATPLPEKAPPWLGAATSPPAPKARAANSGAGFEPAGAAVGSNNAAVAGTRSATGAALVSVDMHLALRLPTIWYRAALAVSPAGAGAAASRVVGVTLPGVPLVVAGSNGRVAWGYTNSYVQSIDLIELDLDPADAARYRAGDGWATLSTVDERIEVAGAAAETLHVVESELGPVWHAGGRRYAIRWIAHDAGAVDLGLASLEKATDLGEALAIGMRAGLPAQNLLAGDAAGHIGWTVAGTLPARETTFATTFPQAASAAQPGYAGWRSLAAARPSIVDPPSGQLSTANARQLAGAGQAQLGDGGADLGARGRQLRDAIAALGPRADETALHGVGLDDRALYLAPWRDRALRVLAANATVVDAAQASRRAEFRRVLETGWTGRASIDSAGYTLCRAWMTALYRRLFGGIDAAMREAHLSASFARASSRWPVVVARLLDEQPPGWLPQGEASWQALQLAAVDDAIADLERTGVPLADAAWGTRNATRLAHPLADAIPLLGRWLAAPVTPQPGDNHMPRVAGPSFGASERLVVSPGHEASGVYAMPGGQSGHPLSPNFVDAQAGWVAGRTVPLLGGPAAHTLTLRPAPGR